MWEYERFAIVGYETETRDWYLRGVEGRTFPTYKDALNFLGQQGWELFQITQDKTLVGCPLFDVWAKRELKENG